MTTFRFPVFFLETSTSCDCREDDEAARTRKRTVETSAAGDQRRLSEVKDVDVERS